MIQENLNDRYELAKMLGIDTGYSIGQDRRAEFELGRFESYLCECVETEQDGFRQYSPFEFTANEFNRPVHYFDNDIDCNVVKEEVREWVNDAIWEHYEDGVTEGIEKAWKEWEVLNALGAPA